MKLQQQAQQRAAAPGRRQAIGSVALQACRSLALGETVLGAVQGVEGLLRIEGVPGRCGLNRLPGVHSAISIIALLAQ
ncbi:hypothetical protein D3C71_1856670 [compost metagenome]